MMEKYYKYGFYFALIIILIGGSIFNIMRIRMDSNKTDEGSYYKKQRMVSLSYVNTATGKTFQDESLLGMLDMKINKLSFSKPIIIIMLSDFGCSPCQVRELKIYQKIFAENKLNVIGIFNTSSRDIIFKMKKASGAEFPLYIGYNELFKKYSVADKYPQILFVAMNKIFSTFIPIPGDDDFSNWYANTLIKNMTYF